MKTVYIVIAGIFAVLGMIVCFENMRMPSQVLVIFYTMTGLFMPLLIQLCIGMVAGFCMGLYLGGRPEKTTGVSDLDL